MGANECWTHVSELHRFGKVGKTNKSSLSQDVYLSGILDNLFKVVSSGILCLFVFSQLSGKGGKHPKIYMANGTSKYLAI